MSDFPTRVHYHPGQNLTSALFTAEQDYHRTMRERHNLAGHEWGIAVGLDLSVDAVGPGLAVDGYGRELVLPVRTQIDPAGAFDLLAVDSVDVLLVYAHRVEPPGDVVVERPRIVLERAADAASDRRRPPSVPPGDEDFDASRPAPHDLAHPWPVYLGTLTRDPEAPADPPALRTTGRPYIGVRAARMSTPDGGIELDLRDGVTVSTPPAAGATARTPVLRWRGATTSTPATLRVEGTLSVAGDLTVEDGRVILPTAVPAASSSGWRLDHVTATGSGVREQLRLVVGIPGQATTATEFVVGAFVDGVFKPGLTVAGDGKVTVHGNLVVEGLSKLEGGTVP